MTLPKKELLKQEKQSSKKNRSASLVNNSRIRVMVPAPEIANAYSNITTSHFYDKQHLYIFAKAQALCSLYTSLWPYLQRH